MILVAGNIATGKSTLAKIISNHFRFNIVEEDVEGNEFIEDFYTDMKRWALHSQLHFITQRAREIETQAKLKNKIILDRSMSEDFHVFSKNLRNSGVVSAREFRIVRKVYRSLRYLESDIDIVIYLYDDVSEILKRIRKRNNFYENDIGEEYVESLNILYKQWRKTCRYEVIDLKTSENDFRKEDIILKIIDKIENYREK